MYPRASTVAPNAVMRALQHADNQLDTCKHESCVWVAGLLGRCLWYRPGLCHCRFRIGPKSPHFLPAKAVLLPSLPGGTPAYHLHWWVVCWESFNRFQIQHLCRNAIPYHSMGLAAVWSRVSGTARASQRLVPTCSDPTQREL
jgi:hypothetical protein